MICIYLLSRVLSVGVPIAIVCHRMEVPGWILALVSFLTWFVGIGLTLTPDGLALLEFRDGLTTTSPLVESWNASDPSPCSWGGINCTDTDEVLNITLINQVPKLEGRLSGSLGKLKSLEVLALDSNLLSGSIPPEIGNLSSLRVLSLSSQNFSGEIPSQLFNCRNLAQLWLNSNKFTGDATPVLEELSKLPAIEQIALDDNSFTGTLPPSIGNATTLTYLSLGQSWGLGQRGGGFSGQIPKEVGKLVNLSTLWLGDNNFTGGIPPELQNLRSLSSLDLGQNNFRGEIPTWLGDLTLLNKLWLRGNALISGTIPSSLGSLTGLNILDLGANSLIGTIPSSLVNLTRLTTLALGTNNLSGTIPSFLENLTDLNFLQLWSNNLTGTIPSFLGNMINLTVLHVGNNSLSGQIPVSLTSLINLQTVYFYMNNLTGPIPEDFGRFMPNLVTFMAAYNSINGTLPDGLCQSGQLQWLTTTHNNLEGPIPSSLANCKTLTQVRLAYNQFTSIPTGFGSNSSLFYLDVSYNQLEGPLPSGLGTNSSLAFLHLNANKLTGNISILEFSKLLNLTFLNLANNNFTGEIPAAMGFCNSLSQLDLSYNSFTGAVPLELGNLSKLQELHLQGNNLTVFHPSIYTGFNTVLRTLNLAENPWNSPIETEIGSLRVLQSLNLSYGGRTGPIPSTLEQLTLLEVLDLSHNNLTGEVPFSLGELMTSLVSVNVSYNNLTGSLPPAWVKFLNKDPTAFQGNPGLCLQYNTDNLCKLNKPRSDAAGKLKLSVKVIVGIVLAALGVALALVVFVALRFRRHKPKVDEMPEEEILTKNLTKEPLPLTFEQILSATDNLSDLHIIGKGGHGTVYKVKCPSDSCSYIAVKKIEFESDVMPTMLHKSFWSEVETVGQARHRNLVRLLGFIKRDKLGLLLYDYISNGNLHSALHDQRVGSEVHLTWKDRLRIARDVAHGLAYLHHDYDAPIVHRDIKSSNVLLDDNLEAYISDFGLAKVLTIQSGTKRLVLSTMNVLGTYGYIAPEIGYGGVATPKVDVYSYGVLLLELLTGKLPAHDSGYKGDSHLVEWVKEKVQLNQGKVSKSVLVPLFLDPTDLAAIDVMLCLQEIALLCTQENPADRPTMREVENMLDTLSEKSKVMDGDGVVKDDPVDIKSSNGREEGWNENGHRNQMSWNMDVNSQWQEDWSENDVGSISSSSSGNPCVLSTSNERRDHG